MLLDCSLLLIQCRYSLSIHITRHPQNYLSNKLLVNAQSKGLDVEHTSADEWVDKSSVVDIRLIGRRSNSLTDTLLHIGRWLGKDDRYRE